MSYKFQFRKTDKDGQPLEDWRDDHDESGPRLYSTQAEAEQAAWRLKGIATVETQVVSA